MQNFWVLHQGSVTKYLQSGSAIGPETAMHGRNPPVGSTTPKRRPVAAPPLAGSIVAAPSRSESVTSNGGAGASAGRRYESADSLRYPWLA